MIAERCGPDEQVLLFDDIKGGERGGAAQQVAAEGVGVRSLGHVEAGREHRGADRDAGAERLGGA